MPNSLRLTVQFAAVLLVLLLPFLLTEIPPVVDYPNHLARAYLLTFGKADPVLARMFAPHWRIIPNLASDFQLPPLLHVMPVYAAGKVVLAVSLLLPVLGGWFYAFCRFGRWSPWSLGAGLVAYNLTFLLGFMNFQIGLGAAFLVAGAWSRWRESCPSVAIAIGTMGAVVVFFCHLIALAFLVVLIGAHEFDWLAGAISRREGRRVVITRALAAASVFVVPFGLYLLSPTSGADGRLVWMAWYLKGLFVLAPFMNYLLGFDALSGLAILALVLFAVRKRWLLIPRATATALAIFAAAYVISPFAIKGGAFFDTRFAIVAGYLLFIGVDAARIPKRAATVIAVCFLLLFSGRMALITFAWREQTGEVAQMREAIRPIPPGSRVLVTTLFPPDPADYWRETPLVRRISGIYVSNAHLPALILLERHAFWQLLFSARSQQPIDILPPYDRSSVAEMNWGPPSYDLLAGDWRLRENRLKFPYLDDWQAKFDFVLILNAGGVPDRKTFLVPRLSLIADTDVAALYRIMPDRSGQP